ncbi:hypothetical protein [Absidia glauca]|uniref:Protein kinase domain-containing protein n=1 Tax=Absidia glauca TaxID=4829 RepID=A0A163JV23_ABSGL|nr:hypothetical protein [Absidia glauca]
MPRLYHGSLKSRISPILTLSWWRQHLSRFSNKSDKRGISPDSSTTTNSSGAGAMFPARDWRSLSPSEPPLPMVPDHDPSILGSKLHSQLPDQTPKRFPHRQTSDNGNLSTIIEESDMQTDISTSPRNSSGHYWQFYQHHDEEQRHSIANTPPPTPTATMSLALDDNKDVSPPTGPSASTSTSSKTSSLSSSSSSSSSTHSFQPPPAWPIHPKTERRWSSSSSSSPTPETKAKRKFTKMIQAAFLFRQENKHNIPSEMELLFDSSNNINQLRLWIHGKIQYHTFEGDAQYIPPELSSRCVYQCDKVDVWVLGISLYRMLVGRYPFHANDDRRLLEKMQHADFGIPTFLSADAKDLLRRMLAPDPSRASLDLVVFHPWLKPYTVLVPPSCPPLPSKPTVEKHHKRKLPLAFHFVKAMVLMVDGPYPPPKQPYRDLGLPSAPL